MLLLEITAAINTAGDVETFYVSDSIFTTSPTDTPPNTVFDPALLDPGSIGVHAYSDGQTGGATSLELGEIRISNSDGHLDDWINYSFDGRDVIIRYGEAGDSYPIEFQVLFTGTVESVEATFTEVILRLRSKHLLFQQEVLTNFYLGNNSLPDGLEGTEDDLKGKPKPLLFGTVFNIEPYIVNTSKLTYQVNDGAVKDIPAVYDRGVLLTQAADYATAEEMQDATPAAGTYITCLAEGYFRLGGLPDGQITADVIQGETAADRTVAQILAALAIRAGAYTPAS